ncbi:MAG: hypothetical protein QM762_09435 [Chryseolinea sp.]
MNVELPYWHFFDALKRELRYSIDIDKYKEFVKMVAENGSALQDKEALTHFCKFLFLQNLRDEEKFTRIFNDAVKRELQHLLTKAETIATTRSSSSNGAGDRTAAAADTNKKQPIINKPIHEKTETPEDIEHTREVPLYFQLPLQQNAPQWPDAAQDKVLVNYLQTDEYFPITRRNMVKAWQFLRHKDKEGYEDEIDVEETTKQIARDFFFINPRYKVSIGNRKDTLMIFADYRGSMAPFHELSNRLIHTATTEGGHPKASVWYFQNCPSGYVYRKSNLTQPVKLKEALATANKNFTLAIVISDGGAARSGKDAQIVNSRLKMTLPFLDSLDKACAHTIWLNPMPMQRWRGSCAELILNKVYLMAPILEHDAYNFQETLRLVLKQDKKQAAT